MIAAFSSLIFLFVSFAVNIANYRLRSKTGANPYFIALGMVLLLFTIVALIVYLVTYSLGHLIWIFSIYIVLAFVEVISQYLSK